ncbi:hypothetical protein EVAR_25727_1 [Eumeta japonica]|uniref:Uncharacterized protein n=1 Tax=Eumeta variegata TaxID=151549 RepID=A0A4C1V7C9_EUMVA|nr:hypothetical protein EVAR_25727_1 [Eumeta japonica]
MVFEADPSPTLGYDPGWSFNSDPRTAFHSDSTPSRFIFERSRGQISVFRPFRFQRRLRRRATCRPFLGKLLTVRGQKAPFEPGPERRVGRSPPAAKKLITDRSCQYVPRRRMTYKHYCFCVELWAVEYCRGR